MSWRSMRACARKTGENKNGDNFIALKNNYAARRVRYREEQKAAEEIDTEVLSLNRKIKLLEDNVKRNEDRSDTHNCYL